MPSCEPSSEGYQYGGKELDLFVNARNWKRYWSTHVHRYLQGDVLEVGAGIGTNTPYLFSHSCRSWICLEPDGRLARELTNNLQSASVRAVTAVHGTIADLDATLRFDVILYVDVLEHIERDGNELAAATSRLKPGGHLIVLSPAHQWLFTEFDRQIGHFRRYDRRTIAGITPDDAVMVRLHYLDSAGVLASFANRVLLRQEMPSPSQVRTWDTWLVPLSKLIDPVLRYRFGKSILSVWRKQAGSLDLSAMGLPPLGGSTR